MHVKYLEGCVLGKLLLKLQSGEGKRNLLFLAEALALDSGSSKEDSRERIRGPALPSEFQPSDLGDPCRAFNLHSMTAFHSMMSKAPF